MPEFNFYVKFVPYTLQAPSHLAYCQENSFQTLLYKILISLCRFPDANVAFHTGAYVNKPFIHVALGKEVHSHSHLCPPP